MHQLDRPTIYQYPNWIHQLFINTSTGYINYLPIHQLDISTIYQYTNWIYQLFTNTPTGYTNYLPIHNFLSIHQLNISNNI